jgi:plasmid stability protein
MNQFILYIYIAHQTGGEIVKAIIIRNFPEDLHYRAKVFAAVHNTTMKDLVIKALEEYLDRNEKKGR